MTQQISIKSITNVELELLQQHIKFYPEQLKSVQENENQYVLLSTDLVTPSQTKGQWKWYQMAEVNDAYKHDRYKQIWLYRLHTMSSVKLFATENSQIAAWPPAYDEWLHWSMCYICRPKTMCFNDLTDLSYNTWLKNSVLLYHSHISKADILSIFPQMYMLINV